MKCAAEDTGRRALRFAFEFRQATIVHQPWVSRAKAFERPGGAANAQLPRNALAIHFEVDIGRFGVGVA